MLSPAVSRLLLSEQQYFMLTPSGRCPVFADREQPLWPSRGLVRPSSPPTSCDDLAPGSQLLTLLRLADSFVENFPRQGFWRDGMELNKVLRDQQLAGREEMELGSNSARTAAQRPAPAVADSLGVAEAPAISASWREQGRGSPAAQRALASMVGPLWSSGTLVG